MSLQSLNESINLVAISTGLLPLYLSFTKIKLYTWVKILFFILLAITILDIINFYAYKNFDNISPFISIAYIYVNIFFFPSLIYFLSNNQLVKTSSVITFISCFLVVSIRFYYPNLKNYIDEFDWLFIQTFFSFLILFSFVYIFKNTKKRLKSNSSFYISFGFLLMYFIPLFFTFIQSSLGEYAQLSYLILNLFAIIGYVFLFLGLKKV